jgi:hypothetical protein
MKFLASLISFAVCLGFLNGCLSESKSCVTAILPSAIIYAVGTVDTAVVYTKGIPVDTLTNLTPTGTDINLNSGTHEVRWNGQSKTFKADQSPCTNSEIAKITLDAQP